MKTEKRNGKEMVVFIHTDHILTSEKGQMKLVSCTGNKKP